MKATDKNIITEHILSLVLYALAEANYNEMQEIIPILDDAIIKIVAEYKKTYGKQQIWEKCDILYQEILTSMQEKNKVKNIPIISNTNTDKID